jgi:hypothetical protein
VAAADEELAEYLRADRAGDIPGWTGYLGKYGTASHAGTARKALAGLYVQVGSADLKTYDGTKGNAEPNYAKLKEAQGQVDLARAQDSSNASAADLNKQIHDEVVRLSGLAKDKLDAYQKALKQQAAGYGNLVEAEKLADAASAVQPMTAEAGAIETQTKTARAAFNKTLHDSEAEVVAQRPDSAAQIISPVKGFAQENQKVADDLQSISAIYVAQAKKLEETPDWAGAIQNLEKAQAAVASPDTQAMLDDAKQKSEQAATKGAADAALQKSQDAESRNDIITAYEVLDDLTREQHALVTDRLEALKARYVPAAQSAAKALRKAHDPINGIGDEVEIQRAYGYLQRCYAITEEPALEDQISILADDLSGYYLAQGKKYADKPDGTGVNIAWTYLSEALQYKSTLNLGAIHDEMTTIRAAHLLKSQLSLKVDFRDQTSRREAVDFAQQLTDAIATGLEASRLGVKVIRPQEATAVQPNFQMVGDVVRHEMSKSQEAVAKESEYRFGQQEVPNDAWAATNRDFQRVNMELQSARSELEGAEAHGKKGEIKKSKEAVDSDQKKVEELQAKLDTVPKMSYQDVIRPYTYTQIIYHLKVMVELQFRILDSSGTEVVPRITVRKDNPRDYSVLQNVKAEDTKGIRTEGMMPNDGDFFEEDEYKARDELIENAKTKVADLPGILLSSADHKAADADNDGAAELYILYLNSTKVADTPERTKAHKFLVDQFNFRDIGKDAATQ